MNYWTEKSIELANARGYLDKLSEIYEVKVNPEREIPSDAIPEIKRLHQNKDSAGLVKKLMELNKFPIDDPYIGSLGFPGMMEKNPETVRRIGGRLVEMDYDTLITLCKQPKSGTRQLGHMFKSWVKNLGYPILHETEFEKHHGICLLAGSDKHLEEYANARLGANLTKGIDMLVKLKRARYIIGEAKFITTYGGTQTNQLNVALDLVGKNIDDSVCIAVVDGAVWFNRSYLEKVKNKDKPVMSALLLKNFIKSFAQ